MDKAAILEKMQHTLENLSDQFARLKHSGKKIIFTQCDSVLYEVCAAHGLVVSKLPRWVMTSLRTPDSLLYANALEYCRLADLLVVPQHCTIIPHDVLQQLPVHTIPHYEGFAEDGVVSLHTIVYSLLQCTGVTQEYPDEEKLQQAVVVYEEIRKIMRSLTTMYAGAFTQGQLQLLCDAAFTLLPQQSVELLQQLYHTVESTHCSVDEKVSKMLIYSDFSDWDIYDNLQEYDAVIAQDDSCNGRRQFDISCHTSSQNMYYELLYAYSFKSWCPGMRKASERCELVYKALPNYDITRVVCIQSFLQSRNDHLHAIYEQCVLQGTDAVIVHPESIIPQFKEYITALKTREHFDIEILY